MSVQPLNPPPVLWTILFALETIPMLDISLQSQEYDGMLPNTNVKAVKSPFSKIQLVFKEDGNDTEKGQAKEQDLSTVGTKVACHRKSLTMNQGIFTHQ